MFAPLQRPLSVSVSAACCWATPPPPTVGSVVFALLLLLYLIVSAPSDVPPPLCSPCLSGYAAAQLNLRRLETPDSVFCSRPLLSCFRKPRRASPRGAAVTNCGGGSSPAGILPHKDCLFCFTWTIFIGLSLIFSLTLLLLCFSASFYFFPFRPRSLLPF